MYEHAPKTKENNTLTRAIIHLENLRFNLKQIKSLIPRDCLICPAVKANAYGHGAVPVARVLKEEGIEFLAVARVHEGRELRLAGIEGPILLFGHADKEELSELIRWELTPFAGGLDYIKALEEAASRGKQPLSVHIKIDTGMGRLGCSVNDVESLALFIKESSWLQLDGLATHFPVSDSNDKEDIACTRKQWEELDQAGKRIEEMGMASPLLHASNSGAIISHPYSHLAMVRPGIMLYGYVPDTGLAGKIDLKPVMSLETSISFIKHIKTGTALSYGQTWRAEEDCWIATLPVGYADGYSRQLSNRGIVWIKGKRYPVVGRVCMDQILVNLGAETDMQEGERVILFGPEPGAPNAWDFAEMLSTIPYEITCGISRRVPRVME